MRGAAWEGGQAHIRGLNIPELQGASQGHQPKRARKLLLHAHEIAELSKAIEREGMTVVALELYFRNGRAKVEIALARGKRKIDKRQSIKERDADREAAAAVTRAALRRR